MSGSFLSRISALFGHSVGPQPADSRWALASEIREVLGRRNSGLVLAPGMRLSARDSFAHLLLVAPTRMGKSTSFCIPNLLMAEGSCVATDPSGELFEATAGCLRARGFDVRVLAPADESRSLRFNPLSYWKTPGELRELATILSGGADPKAGFWNISAVNLLSVVLRAVIELENRYRHPGNVRWLLNHMADRNVMDPFMAEYLSPADRRLFAEYRAFVAQDPKVSASVISTARSFLDLWSDEGVCRVTAQDSLDLGSLRRQRTAIFVIVPEHQVQYFGVLLNLFYSACFRICLKTPTPTDEPVYFLLDEFGNMGRINNFAGIITTVGKRRCSMSLLVQDLSQLGSVYGDRDAQAIIGGGCGSKLFYPGLDLETTRYVEGLLGSATFHAAGPGRFAGLQGTSPLMHAEQIRRMERSEAIFVSGRRRPIRLRSITPFFEHRAWSRMVKKAPVFPEARHGDELALFPFK